MMSSTPSSRASWASSIAEMPQSTVTISAALRSSAKLPEGLRIDPVALVDAMRDVVLDLAGAGQPKARPENARAANPIDVVVAVDHDLSILANRTDDPLGRQGGARQKLRVVKAAHLGFEEGDGPRRVVDAAVDEQLSDQRRELRASAQALDAPRVVRLQPPASVFERSGHASSKADPRGIRTSSDAAHKSR